MTSTTKISNSSDLITPERILFLDNLRAIAIIMVVGVHTLGYCLPLPEHQKTIIAFIVHTVSVPIFFLVDGYLFARSTALFKRYDYIKTIKKSVLRLLVPWVFFSLFYLVTRCFFELSGFLKENMIIGNSLHEVAVSTYGSAIAPQMYFLASLFLIRLCSPIFKRIVIIKNIYIILLLFISYFLIYKSCINYIAAYLRIDGGQEPILHALWGIQYYFVGIIIFKTSELIDLKKLFAPFGILLLVSLFLIKEFPYAGSILVQYSYMITLFLFFLVITNKRIPILEMIGKNTMGIYLIHAPIVLKGVSLFFNKFISVPIFSYCAVLLGTFSLTFLVVSIVNSIPYGSILFGEFRKGNTSSTANKAN